MQTKETATPKKQSFLHPTEYMCLFISIVCGCCCCCCGFLAGWLMGCSEIGVGDGVYKLLLLFASRRMTKIAFCCRLCFLHAFHGAQIYSRLRTALAAQNKRDNVLFDVHFSIEILLRRLLGFHCSSAPLVFEWTRNDEERQQRATSSTANAKYRTMEHSKLKRFRWLNMHKCIPFQLTVCWRHEWMQ